MYIRNVKQIIRAADASFDERKYGFGGLMDLLRACQKEGCIRMERDRRGGLRVFPGAALQRRALDRPLTRQSRDDQINDDAPATERADDSGRAEPSIDADAQPVDRPTAELLGRAKRGGRAQGGAEAGGKRKTRGAPNAVAIEETRGDRRRQVGNQ